MRTQMCTCIHMCTHSLRCTRCWPTCAHAISGLADACGTLLTVGTLPLRTAAQAITVGTVDWRHSRSTTIGRESDSIGCAGARIAQLVLCSEWADAAVGPVRNEPSSPSVGSGPKPAEARIAALALRRMRCDACIGLCRAATPLSCAVAARTASHPLGQSPQLPTAVTAVSNRLLVSAPP